MGNYIKIKPISAFVKADLVIKNPSENTLPCTIIALCAYVGEALTATIRLNCGAVFGYIPFHKLSLTEDSDFHEDMSEVHFENCPDLEIKRKRPLLMTDPYHKIILSNIIHMENLCITSNHSCGMIN